MPGGSGRRDITRRGGAVDSVDEAASAAHGNGKLRAETTTRIDSAVSTARIRCGACDVRDVDYKKTPTAGASALHRRECRRRSRTPIMARALRPSRAYPRSVSDRAVEGQPPSR